MKIRALFEMYNTETRQYFRQGETYDVPEELALEYIAEEHAEPVEEPVTECPVEEHAEPVEEKARAEPTPGKPKGRPKKTT